MIPDQGYTLDFDQLSHLPAIPAVYAVWCMGECLYVGQSQNIQRRWGNHHMGMLCLRHGADRITWVRASLAGLLDLEEKTIQQLHPKLNGNGRFYSEMEDSGLPCMPGGTIVVGNDAIVKLATSDLPHNGIRLALVMAARMSPKTGLVHCSNSEYAAELEVSSDEISRVIGRLAKVKFLHRTGPRLVTINPIWCFRGTPEQQHEAVEEWGKLYSMGIVTEERKSA
jgi:hypothetical protein